MARRGPSLGGKLLIASLLLASGAALLVQPESARLADGPGPGTRVLYAAPLDADEAFDGYPGRWAELAGDPLVVAPPVPGGAGLRLRLATRDGALYGLVEVDDPHPTYRNPGNPALDGSDRLRLELHGDDGISRYRVLAAQGPGRVDVLPSTPDGARPVAGPDLGIEALWQPGGQGFTAEFRLPLAILAHHPVLRVGYHDAAPAVGLEATSPPIRPRYRDPGLEEALGDLAAGSARLWVVDRDGWVRAGAGGPSGFDHADGKLARLALAPLDAALAGRAGSARLALGDGVLVAAVPLTVSGETVGAVVAEQGLDDLLRSRYRTFADFTVTSLALFVASALGLLLFAVRLAWRIRQLGLEAGAAIDARGRQVSAQLKADADSGDELGELSRTISALLGRLQRHGRFVESLPHTLRHELGNPLNSVATALQNLAEETDDDARNRLLERAGRGLARLEQTLATLTEAADLEEALQGDPLTRLDLAALLRGYLENFAMAHPQVRLATALPDVPTWIEGVDHRLEQLLDKLLDNAVDFTPAEGAIAVSLSDEEHGWRLEVTNDGPPLPEGLEGRLFEAPLSARRESGDGGRHLGLGLYVVRRIAEAHGGRVAAGNAPGGRGARFSVWLPGSG